MSENKNSKNLTVRNSTAEFLIFTHQSKEGGIEVRYERETIWLTQKLMAELFDVERSVVTKHLKNIFNDKELDQGSVCAKFAHTASDGKAHRSLSLFARTVFNYIASKNFRLTADSFVLGQKSHTLPASHSISPMGHSDFEGVCH